MALNQKLKLAINARLKLLLAGEPRTAMVSSVSLPRTFLLVILLLGLSACQTAPKKTTQKTLETAVWLTDASFFSGRSLRHRQLPRWRYSAKVGIKTPQLQEQANLVWQFSDQSNDVRLFGPLGVGAIKLEFDEYGVQLSDNQGVLHQGNSAEELLTKIVGWPIPIDALSYWLQGLPYPGSVYEYQANKLGDLVSLRQLNWVISYAAYREYGDQRLARKLTAIKQVSPEQLIKVKLITKNWQWH